MNCYYLFHANLVIRNKTTSELEFINTTKRFEDANPILAREAAFSHYDSFIHGLLLGQGLTEKEIENISDREIRIILKPYIISSETPAISEQEKKASTDVERFTNGIGVCFMDNDMDQSGSVFSGSLKLRIEVSYKIKSIHSIDFQWDFYKSYNPGTLLDNLENELQYYLDNGFDIQNHTTSIKYFDVDEYEDGYMDIALGEHVILKTPFDWTGYDKIYWWGEPGNETDSKEEENDKTLPLTVNEALNKGEHEYAEFKPGLINRPNSARNIEYEIAKTICAFLNSKGGYLFIGVGDKGDEIFGLDFKNLTKDRFRNEYTRIKTHYLPQSIAHTIYGDFYDIEDKTVFIVTVYPSEMDPIFLHTRDEKNNWIKEFYIRSDASSRHIYDQEELVKYCRNRWKII